MPSYPEPASQQVSIMECTLRDGSYAVDFKFTERDTAVLSGVLARIGFRWIEVGHGLGLGASAAGKGSMPASDERLIQAAKSAAGEAKIGCFFIPGIGTLDHLKSARDAGLDFVRVGYNAPEAEKAYPYLEAARKLGLIPCFNFMKTYGVTPQGFAEKAKGGVEAGAEVVYCVDSAGSMFPENVRAYFEALHEICNCTSGFHGHSNLQFAVANSVEAFRCGATFVDATLYGLGRSSGNVPSEVAVAVFENLGVHTGVDLFEVMEVAEDYMDPLISQIRLYDMMAVAMGYSQFHSSFFPKVSATAQKHGVDLRRLVVAMGKEDPVNLDERRLEEVAGSLPKVRERARHEDLVSFSVPGISGGQISSSLEAVRKLVDGLVVTSAKRRNRPVLELVACAAPADDLVLADVVLVDDDIALGRVTFGSWEVLEEAMHIAKGHITTFLVDSDGGTWATEIPKHLIELIGAERINTVSSRTLLRNYLEDALAHAARRYSDFCLLIYGNPDAHLLDSVSRVYKYVAIYGSAPAIRLPDNCILVGDFSDRMHFNLGVSVALCLCPPSPADAKFIDQLTELNGAILTLGQFPRLERELASRPLFAIEASQAYSGQIGRWASISNLLKPSVRATTF